MSSNDFIKWVEKEINQRGWTSAELARRANIAQSHLSRVLSGSRGPGPDLCTGIAQAFKLPPELVFRKAGLLPPIKEETVTTRQIAYLVAQLPPDEQEKILAMIEALSEQHAKQKEERRSVTGKAEAPA